MGWADIRCESGLMEIRVNRDVQTEQDYSDFMLLAEREYLAMNTEFVLVFNLVNFSGVSTQQAAAWMELFERLRSVTERKLICTCVISTSNVVLAGARLFRTLHSPIKPFHVYESEAECMREVRQKLKVCAPRPPG
jgi:hypothetical protein